MSLLDIFFSVFYFLFSTAFIWLPIILFVGCFDLWMTYVRRKNIQKTGFVLLEIRLPEEIRRSPLGMELIFTQLHQKGAATYLDTYWGGKVPPWFSFEIASFGGDVHFYVWTQPKYKDIVEAQIYAQYPTVEIFEVEDYTLPVTQEPDTMWGTYFKFTAPDPYPIKTYVDYGLDKNPAPDEEEKIDPISTMIEYLGSLRPGEQCWIQILIQANKSEGLKEGRFFKKSDWKKDVDKAIENEISKFQVKDSKEGGASYSRFPMGRMDTMKIEALQRSKDKFAFDVAIRGIYLATKEAFSPDHIPGLIGSLRQYNSNELNGFKLGWFTDFDYPWQDFRRIRRNRDERMMLDMYKRRSFFQPPYKYRKQKPIILTTEELATIYHFPGGTVTTPTFSRIPSKKAQAPSNLPT